MDGQMRGELAADYQSAAQQTRVVTEAWVGQQQYCVACGANRLEQSPNNHKAVDFRCKTCQRDYQLKAKQGRFTTRVNDGAYNAFMEALQRPQPPHLLLMSYHKPAWRVQDLDLIPGFSIPPQAIVKRPPLSGKARRHGWVGCYLSLRGIPLQSRIRLFSEGRPVCPDAARQAYRKLEQLEALPLEARGWRLDVLRLLQEHLVGDFTNADAYGLERELSALYPGNRNVRAKIRQQLQELRDLGLLEHLGRGRWRLPAP